MRSCALLHLPGLVCVSGEGSRQITSYVQPKDLPAGTYKAVQEQSGEGVCPELPDLVDFEMVVRNGPQGQSATLGFQDRRAALAGLPPTTSRGPFELALHSRRGLETLKRIGPLETVKLLNCFGIEPRTRASTFVFDLYTRLSLVKPPRMRFYTQIMFCQTEDVGLVVGIGRNSNKNRQLGSFDYGFKLELQSAKEAAALPKEGGRKRVPPLRFRIAPPKRPRKAEEASGGMNADQASSLPDTGDLQVHHLPVSNAVEDAASPPFEDVKKAVDSPPSKLNAGAPPGDGLLDLPLEPQGVHHPPSPTAHLREGLGWERSGGPPASIFDGLYETENTTVIDQLKKISVNISRARTDHPRVELVVEFPHYEIQLCEENAVYQEGCLLFDFLKGAHDPELLIFTDTLGLDYVSPTSFRICQKEGGELVLMFDASRYSEGMPSTTVQLRLRKVNLS